jgi:hypothetical protein
MRTIPRAEPDSSSLTWTTLTGVQIVVNDRDEVQQPAVKTASSAAAHGLPVIRRGTGGANSTASGSGVSGVTPGSSDTKHEGHFP